MTLGRNFKISIRFPLSENDDIVEQISFYTPVGMRKNFSSKRIASLYELRITI